MKIFRYGSSFGGSGAGLGFGVLSGLAATMSVYGQGDRKPDDFGDDSEGSADNATLHPAHSAGVPIAADAMRLGDPDQVDLRLAPVAVGCSIETVWLDAEAQVWHRQDRNRAQQRGG